MVPSTLYRMCLQRICDFITKGQWETWSTNPFSSMPSRLIDDLVSTMMYFSLPEKYLIDNLTLLMKSGRLQHFHLHRIQFSRGPGRILELLSHSCNELRSLSLCFFDMDIRHGLDMRNRSSNDLEVLLLKCPNLEELHSAIFFNPKKLRNCKKLRCLKLCLRDRKVLGFFRDHTPDVWRHLKSLETFSLCVISDFITDLPGCYILYKHIAKIMENSPELKFLGFFDSSMAIKCLQQWDKNPRQFQIRKCYWGDYYDTEGSFSISGFPARIKAAVVSCPLVEELVIEVVHADCLKYLGSLKKLTSLDINLDICDDDILPSFYSLLDEIGSQLKCLRIEGPYEEKIDVYLISDRCRNLESLRLVCETAICEPIDSSVSHLNLKCLCVNICDLSSVLFLLSNCAYLKALCLKFVEFLDDYTLKEILQKNSLSELKVMYIRKCSLSKVGLRMFLQSAQSLENFSFTSSAISDREARSIVKESHPGIRYLNSSLRNFDCRTYGCWM